ncbi:MAG: beta-phosphoglucomutase [Bacteroidales bacterium]|nr:beta-phosphoglucomutase [Bacteroidales bacterium]
MAEIKACIFDMDGVLVSTEIYHFKAWKRLTETLGFSIDEKFNENLKGVSRSVCIDLILKHGGLEKTQEEKDVLAAQKNEWFLEYVNTEITPSNVYPGVINFLETLKQKGYKTAIGSASKNAPLLVEKLGIKKYFDAIVDGNMITKAKPNPEVFLKGAELIGVNPQNCVVFEDAISGVEAAKNGGMFCIGVGSAEILKKADFCINSFTQMSLERLNELA